MEALGALCEVLALVGIEVKARNRKAIALQVQREVFPHHAQAHKADVHGLHLYVDPLYSIAASTNRTGMRIVVGGRCDRCRAPVASKGHKKT